MKQENTRKKGTWMKIALLLRGIQQPLLRGCNSIGTPFFLNVFFLKKKTIV